MANVKTLDDLHSLLKFGLDPEDARAFGLPVKGGKVNLTKLPTFGGEPPRDTKDVLSWDENHVLVTTETGAFAIRGRSEDVRWQP